MVYLFTNPRSANAALVGPTVVYRHTLMVSGLSCRLANVNSIAYSVFWRALYYIIVDVHHYKIQ